MQHQRILQVKELNRGVKSIMDVDWKHPDIKTFAVLEGFSSASTAQDSKSEDSVYGIYPGAFKARGIREK